MYQEALDLYTELLDNTDPVSFPKCLTILLLVLKLVRPRKNILIS